MKRPTIHDINIVKESCARWAEKARERFPDLADNAGFADLLLTAVRRSSTMDAAGLAASLSDRIYEPVDSEMLEAMEDYLAHHTSVHRETVTRWLQAWVPERPFQDFARVVVQGLGGEEEGIGLIDPKYEDVGQFLFFPDSWHEEAVDPSGRICRWKILKWEEAINVRKPSEEDVQLIGRHRSAQERNDEETAVRRRKNEARHSLSELVKTFRHMDETEAADIYAQIAGSPEVAARIIAALEKAAVHEITEMTTPMPQTPKGMLL